MDALTALLTRNAANKLDEPAPDKETLQKIFDAAIRVPDHARLKPWRFLLIEGDARLKLGELFVDATREVNPDVTEEVLQKVRGKSLRAPLIVIVIAAISEHSKVPRIEQQLSAGCAAQNILLASHALDYAGIWRTGSMAYNKTVHRGLGMAGHEEIVGFIYLGTRIGEAKVLPDLDHNQFYSVWNP